jgi:DNA-binding response OmpR family regulator
MKILIIEDEIQLVKSVALALREEGYVCEFAYFLILEKFWMH